MGIDDKIDRIQLGDDEPIADTRFISDKLRLCRIDFEFSANGANGDAKIFDIILVGQPPRGLQQLRVGHDPSGIASQQLQQCIIDAQTPPPTASGPLLHADVVPKWVPFERQLTFRARCRVRRTGPAPPLYRQHRRSANRRR